MRPRARRGRGAEAREGRAAAPRPPVAPVAEVLLGVEVEVDVGVVAEDGGELVEGVVVARGGARRRGLVQRQRCQQQEIFKIEEGAIMLPFL